MPHCTVHLNSYGDALAKGMSWPFRATDFQAMLATRPEPDIWLDLYKRDEVKKWAKAGDAPGSRIELARCSYEDAEVSRKVDWSKDVPSLKPPAWLGLDDPPLVSAWMRSLPAQAMRTNGLTKVGIATAFSTAFSKLGPRHTERITARDWRVSLFFDAAEHHLIGTAEHKPGSRWVTGATLVLPILRDR